MVTDLKTTEEQMKKLTGNGGMVSALKQLRGCWATSPASPKPPGHPLAKADPPQVGSTAPTGGVWKWSYCPTLRGDKFSRG